jgi:hypothetical protein
MEDTQSHSVNFVIYLALKTTRDMTKGKLSNRKKLFRVAICLHRYNVG